LSRSKDKPQSLSFTVTPAMPRLEGELSGLPDTMLAGEVCRCRLRLTNVGSQPLASLRLAVGHPDVLCARSGHGLGGDLLDSLSGDAPGGAWRHLSSARCDGFEGSTWAVKVLDGHLQWWLYLASERVMAEYFWYEVRG
jgi:hypothetical protein